MDSYLAAAMGPATRKNARSGLRKLDNGEYRVTHADRETLDRDLDILMGLWATKWLPSKGDATTRLQAEDHRTMLRTAFLAGEALVAVLWQGDTPLAGQGSLIGSQEQQLDLSCRQPRSGRAQAGAKFPLASSLHPMGDREPLCDL